jgi:DNA-binding NarL/FixJ family response regulator
MESKHTIRVLIADDHDLYLEGLKTYFQGNELYEVCGEASNGEELVRKTALLKPHIVLTDLKMPLLNGAAAIRQLLAADPAIKCIALTNYENDVSIIEALESGAKGYITKNMPKKELFGALDQVSKGYPYYCLTTSTKMIRLLGKSPFNPYAQSRISFSDTERKIIQLVCQEKDNKEIAAVLFMSIRTVENNRSRILKKMNARSAAGIAIYAIKHGLYFLDE